MLKKYNNRYFLSGWVMFDPFYPWVTIKSPFGRNMFATSCNHFASKSRIKSWKLNFTVRIEEENHVSNFYVFKFYIVYLA